MAVESHQFTYSEDANFVTIRADLRGLNGEIIDTITITRAVPEEAVIPTDVILNNPVAIPITGRATWLTPVGDVSNSTVSVTGAFEKAKLQWRFS